ncbi:hypothetical protein MWU49_16840 [Alcanivorax sp. S6407]|uniref:hypothetical protein n=1 Tax=Alcanivorax sp. S6407 TaxID=2926424 RepID=UPI001FF30324|nr:hypothetical protein [Alcanivorax sp. S6407]MCK0155384.1 hypothetical protein [Alcanivorax sp. S6407]
MATKDRSNSGERAVNPSASLSPTRKHLEAITHRVHRFEAGISKLEAESAALRKRGDESGAASLERKVRVLRDELLELQNEAARSPEIASALGLESRPLAELDELPAVVKAAKFETMNIELAASEYANLTPVASEWPRGGRIIKDGVAEPVQTVGKVRMLVNGENGEAAGNVPFRLEAKDAETGKPLILRHGNTNKFGYASVNLGNFPVNRLSDMQIVVGQGNDDDGGIQRSPIMEASIATHRDLGVPHQVFLRPDILEKLKPRFPDLDGPDIPGTIEDPDDIDIKNSPRSFGLNEEHVDGNCCLRPRTEFPAREYHFRQIVRLKEPDLNFREKAIPRQEVRAPIPFGDESASVYGLTGGNILLGTVNMYRQGWYPVGRGLGELLYSLALAPCEQVNLAFIDWSRTQRDTRVESRVQREQMEHELSHDRAIEEVVDSVLTEKQTGESHSGGGGASLDLGFFSIGGGGGGTSSTTTGRRSLQASTLQDISDDVTQRASSVRSQRSTVVTTSSQRESERIQTRTVHNHNRNHAMTVQYFQVLSHYAVKTELVEEKPVVLVPYDIEPDIFDDIPSFNKYVLAPSRPITRFLDRHSRLLRRMVPRSYRKSFEALSRLLHCRDVYDIEQPYATFSRWRINLNKAWRPGLTLTIETEDGQSYPLYPRGGSASKAPVDFVSDPVRTDDIEAIRIGFDPVEAARVMGGVGGFGIFGESIKDLLEQAISHKISSVEIMARTDRSRFVPERQSFRLDVAVTETTLTNDNPHASFAITPPSVSFEGYRGREHEDYCRLKKLIAYIQSRPMRFLRAIWFFEDPDRRAMRFDRFQFQGNSLLDSIVNKPVGVLGNYVAFELLEGHRLVQLDAPNYMVSSRMVSLPTRGVFAEVFLSCCNATEKRDVERFIDPEQSCQKSAPEITGVTPGSRVQGSDTRPTDFATPMINLQNAPAVPNPNGMTAGLNVMGTPDIFRDLSRGAELLQFINNATKEAFTSTRQHRAAMDAIAGDVVRGLVSAYTGTPISSSGSPSAASSGTTGIQSSPSGSGTSGGGSSTAAAGDNGTLQALTGEMVRQSSPSQVSDHVQTVRRAVESGLLSEGQGNAITNSLLGGTQGGVADSTAPVIILTAPTSRDGLAFGPATGDKSGTLTLDVNVNGAPEGAAGRWTRPNPDAMALSDQDAETVTVTPLIPGRQELDYTVRDTSGTALASIKVPLSVPQFVAVREEAAALDAVLTHFSLDDVKAAVLQVAKQTCDLLLNTSNVRTIWELAPFNESLPAQFASGGAAANRVTVATLRGNPPSAGLAGLTSPGTGGIGPTVHDEPISVWPGAFDDAVAGGAAGDVDDATRQIVQTIQGLDFTDIRLKQLGIDIIGRLMGETLAHEILHSLLGFLIPGGHHTPAIASDIMNNGFDRSFQNRTGFEIVDLPNFPDEGSYVDNGIGLINIPTATTQALIDQHFPVSI